MVINSVFSCVSPFFGKGMKGGGDTFTHNSWNCLSLIGRAMWLHPDMFLASGYRHSLLDFLHSFPPLIAISSFSFSLLLTLPPPLPLCVCICGCIQICVLISKFVVKQGFYMSSFIICIYFFCPTFSHLMQLMPDFKKNYSPFLVIGIRSFSYVMTLSGTYWFIGMCQVLAGSR